MSMEWKDMDWLDFITWLSEEHKDIAKPTLNKIVEKTIHWKNERLKRND